MFCHWILLTVTFNLVEINSQRNDNIRTTTESPSYTLQRIRSQRVEMLRSYILESLGFDTPPQVNRSRAEAMTIMNVYKDRTIEESRCYLPSCSISSRINRTMWNEVSTASQNIYFDIIANNESVVNAKLKLRVLPNTESGETESQRYIVTLYQYTKPLRRKKKTRLLGANMIVWSDVSSWTIFNVTEAVREWATEDRKNNGLLVEITPATDVNIRSIFSPPDCLAHVDIDCGASETPYLFRGRHNAILEVVTERALFG